MLSLCETGNRNNIKMLHGKIERCSQAAARNVKREKARMVPPCSDQRRKIGANRANITGVTAGFERGSIARTTNDKKGKGMAEEQAGRKLIAELKRAAEEIRELEAEAREALHEDGDRVAYESLLRRKCEVLLELPGRVEPLLQAVDSHLAQRVGLKSENLAERAQTALEVGSVFFMYALLYPEDHKEGDPNDLERFILGLEKA